MPRGPKGQERPADVIRNAVLVMQIATGEAEQALTKDGKNKAAVTLGRMGCLPTSQDNPATRLAGVVHLAPPATESP